jgi:hypothetical protein
MIKKKIIGIVIMVGLTCFQCNMERPFPKDYHCDIKAHKIFNVPISKADIFKKQLEDAHPYSSNNKINLIDSMYYIYCPGNEGDSKAIFECKIKSINDSTTLIETYRVAWFSIVEDKELENNYTTLTSDNYLKLFADNFVSHLKNEYTLQKFFQDNKKAYDEWQTSDQHVLDSLDKAYKKRDSIQDKISIMKPL